MVLTRATRDAAAEWDVEPDVSAERARVEKRRRGRRDARPDAFVRVRHSGGAGAGRGADTPRDRDARERCDVAAGARPAGAADVLGAALNYVRFATMRGSRADRAGAWRRRREVMAASVVPARAWAARRLDAIVAEEARERGVEEGGIDAREGGVGSADGSAPRGGGVRSRGGVCARGGKPRGDRAVDGEGEKRKRRESGGESGGSGGSGGGSVGPRVDVGGRAKVPGMYWYRL